MLASFVQLFLFSVHQLLIAESERIFIYVKKGHSNFFVALLLLLFMRRITFRLTLIWKGIQFLVNLFYGHLFFNLLYTLYNSID